MQSPSLLQHEEEYFHQDHFYLEEFCQLRAEGFPGNQDMTMIHIQQAYISDSLVYDTVAKYSQTVR